MAVNEGHAGTKKRPQLGPRKFSAIERALGSCYGGGSVPLRGPSVPLTAGCVPLTGLFYLFNCRFRAAFNCQGFGVSPRI